MATSYISGEQTEIQSTGAGVDRPEYDVETGDGQFRLRARHADDRSIACLQAFNFDEYGPILISNNKSLVRSKNLVTGKFASPSWGMGVSNTIKRFGAASLVIRSMCSLFALPPENANENLNIESFTVECDLYLTDVTNNGGYILTDYIHIVGLKRWSLSYSSVGKTFTVYTFDAGGALNVTSIPCATLTSGTWYAFRFSYDRDTTTVRMELRTVGDVLVATIEDNAAKAIPIGLSQEDMVGFAIGGIPNDNLTAGLFPINAFDSNQIYLDDVRYYSKQLPQTFSTPGASRQIFSVLTTGNAAGVTAIGKFDAGGSATWDMSSLLASPANSFAFALGADGWEVCYQYSDIIPNPLAGWSAWMTAAGLLAEPDPTGRYLWIGLRCNCADGIDTGSNTRFYIDWVSVDFALGGAVGAAPILNSLTNDLTGTSITLNITPPSDVGYSQTEIIYRRMSGPNGIPVSSWTSGGFYVGVGGVPGNKQVIGLEQDQLYEFLLYADYGAAGYSSPSIAMRIVTTDDGDSVVERIIRDIAAWIRSIAVVDGYNFDIKDVRVIRSPAQAQLEEYPGVILYIDNDRYNDERPTTALGSITHHVVIKVEGWITAYEEDERLDDLEGWVADLERAILEGRRRSGQARTTSIKASARHMAQGSEPYGGVVFEVEVYYVTDFGNPYQRR